MKTLFNIASKFIGIKEVGNNEDFNDPEFAELMYSAGFKKGDPWCMTFVKVCVELYLAQINSGYIKNLRSLNIFNAGSQGTFEKIKKYYPLAIVDKPTGNSIIIWRKYVNGKPTKYGHGAIINFLNDNLNQVHTIDGNTNTKGSREGDSILEKNRHVDKFTHYGLRFRGYISIDKLIKLLEDETKRT